MKTNKNRKWCWLFLIVAHITLKVTAQQVTIKGKVLDSITGMPVANVMVATPTKAITVTDHQGVFDLGPLEKTEKIWFTLVGYRKQERTVADLIADPVVSFVQEITALAEVEVATGYQRLSKDKSTGSYVLINEEKLNQQVGTNILSRLDGVANSVRFDSSSQRPAITIRGQSTINAGTSPLIILDNFPYSGNIADINPNDVSSISILRDASAASIWGAKAGNGVIVITTRKATYNQKMTIDFTALHTSRNKPDVFSQPNFMGAAEYIGVERLLFERGYYNNVLGNITTYPVVSPAVELMDQFRKGSLNAAGLEAGLSGLAQHDVRNDIDRYLYQNGSAQQYALTIRGGAEKSSYLVFAGLDRSINHLNALDNRLSLRLNNSFTIAKGLNLSGAVLLIDRKQESGRNDYTAIRASTTQGLYPYARLVDQTGSPLPIPKTYRSSYVDTAGNGRLLDWHYYPLTDNDHARDETALKDLLGNLELRYTSIKWLSASVKYQYQYQQQQSLNQYDEGSFFANDFINRFTQLSATGARYNVPRGSILDRTPVELFSHRIRAQADFKQDWRQHQFNALIGGEINDDQRNSSTNRTYGYNSELAIVNAGVDPLNRYPLYYGGTAVIGGVPLFNGTRNRFVSYYGNFSYHYSGRYVLSGSLRKDMSNLFGVNSNQKGRPFWSSGFLWNISEENFYTSTLLPVLRLRLSYGFSGNIDNSLSAHTVLRYTSPNTDTGFPQAVINKFQNPDLRWEKTGIWNASLEFSSKNQRITGNVSYYHKNGTDLFGDDLIDITTGLKVATIRKNVAAMTGRGVDAELSFKLIENGIKWSMTTMFSYQSSTVKDYYLNTYQGSNYVNGRGEFVTPIQGRPIYSMFSYRWAGLNGQNGNPIGYLDNVPSENYVAITSTGTSLDQLAYHGSATPLYFGAINQHIAYKGWTVSFNISYKLGYYFRRNTISYNSLFAGWQQHEDFNHRWQQPGDEQRTTVPSMVYPSPAARDAFYSGAEALIEKGDHFRLQYLNVGYVFKQKALGSLPFKSLSVNLNATNPSLIWTANKAGLDPDNANMGRLPKSYSINLRTSF